MTGRREYLFEVAGLLWPGEDRVRLGRSGSYVLVPSAVNPRLLLPAGGTAAAAAVLGYGGHGSARAWLLTRAMAAGLVTGLARPVLRDRLTVGAGEPGFDAHLSEVLGQEVVLALHIGPPRANRKPVLQLLTPRGQTVGYAKLGVNALTRRLVRAETAALNAVSAPGVTVPTVLHAGEWRGLTVLVQSPLPVRRSRPTRPDRRLAAMLAVSAVSAVSAAGQNHPGYPDGLRTRVAALPSSPAATELRAALEHAAQGPELPVGAWHGDWTPWNTAYLPGADTVLIWDWERYATGVPLGFDALHHHLQAALAAAGGRRPEHATALLAAAPGLLAPFGVDEAAARRTAALYLIEIATRYLADDQAGAGGAAGAVGTWLLPALRPLN